VQVAEDVGAYKPADEVFARALERIGEAPENVLHVAFGFKYDIGPAAQAGMSSAWVKRHQEPPPGYAPFDHEWRDLWSRAEPAESQRG
jgi:FMN phosphatase YigB (HAD superfamily)